MMLGNGDSGMSLVSFSAAVLFGTAVPVFVFVAGGQVTLAELPGETYAYIMRIVDDVRG